jgi:protein-S-isoprenylcysteine O-methyltransferase Ste14
MSALSEALPLALAAAVYPPALLVLLLLMGAERPRPRVVAYFGGAALVTIGAGLVALAVLDGAGLTRPDSRSTSGWVAVVLGLALLALAAWAWRRARRPAPAVAPAPGRIATWSGRAVTSRRWAFVLGLAMYLPSPLYLLAVKEIGDSGDTDAAKVLAVLICALAVLLFVELPLLAAILRPDAVEPGLRRVSGWLGRRGWQIVAVLALAAGMYALAQGLS